jgi:hypothetical protein
MSDTEPPLDSDSLMIGLRSAWEVTAGLIPGQAMDEYAKRYFFTSDDPEGRFHEAHREAIEYAGSLMNPHYVNWVRLDWIWL